MARSIISKPHDPARTAVRLLPLERGAADEVALGPREDPLEVGFEHRRGVVDVVPIKAHGRLEAQRVARAKAGGLQAGRLACLQDCVPEPLGVLRRDEDFEAVFAGVPRAGDRRADRGHFPGREPVVLDRREVHARQHLQDLARGWALERDQRIPAARVHGDRVAGRLDLLADPGEVLRDVAGVHDEQEMRVGESVDEQVVHEGALFGGQTGVLNLPDLQLRGVVARDPLDRSQGVVARDFDLAHVAHVKQPGARTDSEVFVGDARILHGHVPAAEGHHAGAEGDVAGVKRGLLQCGRLDLTHWARAGWPNIPRYYARPQGVKAQRPPKARPPVSHGQLKRGLAILRVDGDELESGGRCRSSASKGGPARHAQDEAPAGVKENDLALLVSLAYKF
jgi:hypothetical protein